jgi:predicted nuclease of predicted toxin-antitoxin system
LSDLFPGSAHVDAVGLGSALDEELWAYALVSGLTVVSKDEDYSHLSALRGVPPKVLWLLTANCTTARVEELIRSRAAEILAFADDPEAGVLALE